MVKDRALEDADARLGAIPPIGAAAAGDGAAASMTVPMAAAKPRRSVVKFTNVSLALAADRHRALYRAFRIYTGFGSSVLPWSPASSRPWARSLSIAEGHLGVLQLASTRRTTSR